MKKLLAIFLALSFAVAAYAQDVGGISGTGVNQNTTSPAAFSVLTSGTGATFSTPSGAKWLEVEVIAGGGPGGAVGTTCAGSCTGSAGNNSSFAGVTAVGGGAGAGTSGAPGAAGAGGTGGTDNGYTTDRLAGQPGNQAGLAAVSTSTSTSGGSSTCLQGGASTKYVASGANSGNAGATNTGGGGGGASSANNTQPGGGGGGGECVRFIIANPPASITYTVGAATTGPSGSGTGAAAGGNGAAGRIKVVPHFNY